MEIKPLPILERWDCHHCSQCCRGHTVYLDEADRQRLEAQEWHKQPQFQGQPVLRRLGWWRPEYVLEQKADGSCVFLGSDGLCEIHRQHGEAAKPWPCRMFPFQLLPYGTQLKLTMRRSCPSAAGNLGRPLAEHTQYVRQFQEKVIPKPTQLRPPRLTKSDQRDWDRTLLVGQHLAKLLHESNGPLVRRMLHATRLVDLLANSRIHRFDINHCKVLLGVLSPEAEAQVDGLFMETRQPLSRAGAILFRQTAANYARFHPNLADRPGWRERLRLLRAAWTIVRGIGSLPRIHPDLPEATFSQLEEPIGHQPAAVLQPFADYFQAMANSLQYCGPGRSDWPVLDGFRALALAYPIGMWLLRWITASRRAAGEQIQRDDAIQVICMLDRSHFYPLLLNSRHQQRLDILASLGDLERAILWYAR